MHQNISQTQQIAVKWIKEVLEILEVKKLRPIIMTAFAVSEKPLNLIELSARTELSSDDIKKELDWLIEKDVIIKAKVKSEDQTDYFEVNPDARKAVFSRIKSKVEKINKLTSSRLKEMKSLLYSKEEEYESFDRLMVKYIGFRLTKIDFFHNIVCRRLSMLNFFDGSSDKEEPIKKIDIE